MDSQKTVGLIRRVKHDIGNDLQVLSGFFELGNYDSVKQYLKKIVDEINHDRVALSLSNPDAALYFYEQKLLCRDIGLNVKYNSIDEKSYAILSKENEPFNSLKSIVIDNNIDKDDIVIEISIIKYESGIQMIFNYGNESKIVRLFI